MENIATTQTYQEMPTTPAGEDSRFRDRLRSRLGHTIAGSLACLGVMSGIGVANASSAEADAALIYEVTNTNTPTTAGVFSRNSPRVADTPRIAGHGAYNGDKVELICGVTNGDAVGPHDNNTWHYVKNLSRPNQPKFWLSDRHVLSPNRADTLAPGEKNCNEQNVTPQPATAQKSPKSVFYSPLNQPTGLAGARAADINKAVGQWSSGDCEPRKALENIPETVDTLAGWSAGRLGPIYYLASASPEQRARIKNIVLVDPGNTKSFEPYRVFGVPAGGRCDDNYDVNGLLGEWLKQPGNYLTILAGRTTEEKQRDSPVSKSTFKGLWKNYLAGIWNQSFADRAKICDYDYMDHEEIMRQLAATAIANPISCPVSPTNTYLTEWHP